MKKLLTFSAFATLLCLMPLTAWAQNSVSTTTTTENITKTSTVYVGEVIVDGESQIKYLYSNDVSINNIVIQNLLVCLEGMADSDYATLLEGHEFDYDSQATGFAICSNPDLVATMGENWSSAQYVGTLYYPDKTVTSEINSNLYDIDEGFKAALDAQTEERNANIDTPVDAEKCFVSHLDVRSSTDVWYTIEDGQVVRHSDITIVHDSEATTVIYTKVELASGSTSTLCYIERDGRYLMLRRNKKRNDINAGKYIGVGGHVELHETPEECIVREAREETGLELGKVDLRGIITFAIDDYDEVSFLYTCTDFRGEISACAEGDLCWVKKELVPSLPLWEGDAVFLRLLNERTDVFSLRLTYKENKLTEATLDGRRII